VEGTLHAYYGPESLQLAQFRNIDFFPRSFVVGGPESHFVNAFLEGVEIAESYLRSRMSELGEDAENMAVLPSEERAESRGITRKVFVVHGHDHGSRRPLPDFFYNWI
jgi:hypothetical protein